MVKQIQCYEDSKGRLHRDPFDAHKADFALWLVKSGDVSEASSIKVAEKIADDPRATAELIDMLKSMQSARPAQVESMPDRTGDWLNRVGIDAPAVPA